MSSGVPRALLTGGYYGRLLRKVGHELDAIGVAVYLNELDLLFRSQRATDVDALILYDGGADFNALLDAADALRAEGTRVRLERAMPEDIRCGKVYRFGAEGLKEAVEDA